MPLQPLNALASAAVLGVTGQALASLLRMPAIVFLFALGLAAGPHGLGLVRPADLGEGLRALTSAFVAIILFEGGLTLRPTLLRQAATPVRRLVTWGAAITLVGATALAHFLVQLPWPLALLYASLVVVTGPTVIAPILQRVPLRPRLHAVLKSESILIDPVGVFIAAVALQYVAGAAGEQASWTGAVTGFVARIGVGAVVGVAAGTLGAGVAQLRLFRRAGNDHLVSLGALGLALAAYVVAERFQHEAGVMAVIVLGLILAAVPLPFREELEQFKVYLTTLGVSLLFILLAANLNLGLLLRAGWREAALLAGLLLLVRPAAVFLSTRGTAMDWREKAYLGLVAPRGIVAAAMASYCANRLRLEGIPGGNHIELLVFLTIGVTVAIQGTWASPLARLLGVRASRPQGVLLVGVNDWSLALAAELRCWSRHVAFLDSNPVSGEVARERGFAVHEGDATDEATYQQMDLSEVGMMLAMTPNDAVNTLACEAARSWLGDRAVFQVSGTVAADGSRPRVRLAGRRALPTAHHLREVVQFFQEGRLRLDTETLTEPTAITGDLPTSRGPLIPLLVLDAGRLRLAIEGHVCAANAVVIGLVLSPRREPAVRALTEC